MKWLLRAAAVAMVLAIAFAAGAQESAPTAEQIKAAAAEFDQGRQAFRAGDYAEAADYFEAADRHASSAKTLELAIRSRYKAGQLDRAASLAALGLARNPGNRGIKDAARPVLKRAAKQLYRVDVHCSTPCDLVVGTKLVFGKASTQKTVYLKPGDHELRAGWSGGRNASHKVTATAGGETSVSFKEPPKPPPAESKPIPAAGGTPTSPGKGPGDHGVTVKSKGWSPLVFWIGTGLTVAAGGVTIWSGIDTQNNPGTGAVRSACQSGDTTNCKNLYNEGLNRQHRTNILAGVTAGLGVVTIVVGAFATDWSGGPPEKDTKKKTARGLDIKPWVSVGNGATLGATGRF